jgi:hypothetical protein
MRWSVLVSNHRDLQAGLHAFAIPYPATPYPQSRRLALDETVVDGIRARRGRRRFPGRAALHGGNTGRIIVRDRPVALPAGDPAPPVTLPRR